MEFTILETKKRKIDIDNKTMGEITLAFIEKKFDIRPDMWIEDNNLMEEKEYISSHKWYADEKIREATKEDEIILEASKIIKKKIKG